jgi:hypothetical protein
MHCTCGKTYEGDDEDTLIASMFTRETTDAAIMEQMLVSDQMIHYAEYDRVNQIVQKRCPCGNEYMIQIVTDVTMGYKCGKCHTFYNGYEL